jgi:hypothetical protein
VSLHTRDTVQTFTCVACGKDFERVAWRERSKAKARAREGDGPYCSKSCASKAHNANKGRGAVHGTLSTYTNYKCRCPACRAANSAYHKEAYKRRTEPQMYPKFGKN